MRTILRKSPITRCTVVRLARPGVEGEVELTGIGLEGTTAGPEGRKISRFSPSRGSGNCGSFARILTYWAAGLRLQGIGQAHHFRQMTSFCAYERPAWAGLDEGNTVVRNPAAANSPA